MTSVIDTRAVIFSTATGMSMQDVLTRLLPDAALINIRGVDVTISSTASGKAIFDAERELRRITGVKYELFMERAGDKNKLRIRLAKLRGVGGAA